jgi:hypothetical protein
MDRGEPGALQDALARLEVIGTFLSVGTPVQAGLEELPAPGTRCARKIVARIRANRAAFSPRAPATLRGSVFTPTADGTGSSGAAV